MKHIRRLHTKLRERYPWYDTWHNHPKHEFFHWVIFAFLSAFIATSVFLNAGYGLSENRGSEKNHAEIPASQGAVSGRVPDQILVAFAPNTGQGKKDAVFARHGLKEKTDIEGADVALVRVPANKTPEETVLELGSEDGVDFAEVDALLAPSFTPNDPGYINEWYHPKINSPLAWDSATGAGVTIAIIDTGVDLSHPDLAPNLVAGWNFYDGNSDANDIYGHGTEVAGAAAASGNNNIEIAGTAYNAKIMPLRVGSPAGYASYSAIASAISYAANHGAKIANVSYQAGGSSAVQRAAKYMKNRGGLTVVAEGNTGTASKYKNSADIISVSATDNYDAAASWSSYEIGRAHV